MMRALLGPADADPRMYQRPNPRTTRSSGVIHPDMGDAEYFAHPALSHSDCKLLLQSPARYRWLKDNPGDPYVPAFAFGHVVHELVLGVGAGFVVIDAPDWRSKAARESRDAAMEAHQAPILAHEYEQAKACADAVRRHPVAKKLLDHLDHAEIACTWQDGDVERKAKLDGVMQRFGLDLKTAVDASTEAFGRSAGKYGYFSQDPWYRDALTACLGIDDPAFLFIVVENHPPYLVNVIQLDTYDVELGTKRNRRAIDLYRHCRDTGEWPGYGTEINTAQLPRWAEMEEEAA